MKYKQWHTERLRTCIYYTAVQYLHCKGSLRDRNSVTWCGELAMNVSGFTSLNYVNSRTASYPAAFVQYLGTLFLGTTWTRAFLRDRQMWVVIDGECSAKAHVVSGVLRATVLGPLLFLLFIKYPSQVSPGIITCLFADDMTALFTEKLHRVRIKSFPT